MESTIKTIFEKIMKQHYIKTSKVGLWLLDGDARNSFVGIGEEDPVDYQVFFHHQEHDCLSEKEWRILFHELAHIVIFEKISLEKGMKAAREEITKYEDEVERLRTLPEKEKQKQYKQIEMERMADELSDKFYNQMKEEGLLNGK